MSLRPQGVRGGRPGADPASAAARGLPLRHGFRGYLRPLFPGDKLRVTVTPTALTTGSFTLAFEIHRVGPPEKLAARARTEHVCITAASRQRLPLPPALAAWINAG